MDDHISPDEIEFIKFFSLQSLRGTWTSLRKEIRKLEIRDVLDWIDWSISIDSSLDQLRKEIISGSYSPNPPTRYEVGKSKGSYRLITALNIRDALVYRHICDFAYEKSLPLKIKGAYFSRRHSPAPVGATFSLRGDAYYSSFQVWLRYHEYRTGTLLNDIYVILVVTDITNYFDSISHNILLEYLAPLGLPRKSIGLLGRLLEAFKPPTGHSPNPRIGLAVDEIDCSRELAHIFLFEHDHRIANDVGEDNYVRWMDDQNIGARDIPHAKKIVNTLIHSLSTQRLTLNDGKTKFLTPDDVVVHFQLEANTELNNLEKRHNNFRKFSVVKARNDFEEVWQRINFGDHVDIGNWNKILKRVYGIATRVNSDVLEDRCLDDLSGYPWLSSRIFQYLAKRNKARELYSLFLNYCNSGSNLFEATEANFFEAILLLDLTPYKRTKYLDFASQFSRGVFPGQTGRPLGRSSSILVLYWLGEKGTILSELYTPIESVRLPKEVARTWISCTTAIRPRSLSEVRARLFGHPADDVSRIARFLNELLAGNVDSLGNYKSLKSRWPLPGKFYDPRAWLLLDLASHTKGKNLRNKLRNDLKSFKKYGRTRQEKRVLSRISSRLKS